MEKFRFLTSGESHGKCLTAIIEGVPAGIPVDVDFINNELKRRQSGYGRGQRMDIESDTVEITSGVRFGYTLGSPVTLVIKNKDFDNWKKVMSSNPEDVTDDKSFSVYRPGHADYTGSIKYKQCDLRNILERASARKTAIEVAVGAIAKTILKCFDIECCSKIVQIGCCSEPEKFEQEIDNARNNGDSLGGKFTVTYKNLPVGLGSYVHWDRGIDGEIAKAVMSIPAVKVVEIGDNPLGICGSQYHDEFKICDNKTERVSNHAGGIEGGITNGQDLVVSAVMKPIPTMKRELNSVDMKTNSPSLAHYERADVCAVESCCVVAESRIAWVLVNEFLLKFGGDSLEELKSNYHRQ